MAYRCKVPFSAALVVRASASRRGKTPVKRRKRGASKWQQPGEDAADILSSIKEDPESFKEVCDQLFPPGEVNWKLFWSEDDYQKWYPRFVQAFRECGGYDPENPERDPEPWEQAHWLGRATSYLRTRKDFIEFLPHGWNNTWSEADEDKTNDEAGIIGDEIERPWNPETNAWDLRAMAEKQKCKSKIRQEWLREKAYVGTELAIDVLAEDVRFTEEEREMFEMTDEEAWHFITQGGTAADPFEVLSTAEVCNPHETVDFPGDEGLQCIEEVDDYLKRLGHWHETEDDLVSQELELTGTDYREYMDAAGPLPQKMDSSDKSASSPIDAEPPSGG